MYAFNPDNKIIADGATIIKDKSCNTLCSLGGFGGPQINKCNGENFWQSATLKRTIWKKNNLANADATVGNVLLSDFKKHMKFSNAAIIFFLLVFAACKKSEIADGTPSCIYNEIASNKIKPDWGVASVEEYMFQNKMVYVFNPGNNIADAPSIIKDENCNTICSVGGFGIGPRNMCNGDIFYQVATLKRTIWKKK